MKKILCIAVLACGIGCRSNPSISPYAEPADLQRQTSRAEALSREAANLIYADPVKAEKLLREALVADLFYGPAHNNLGVLFLNAGKLYEAAHEFAWAGKLMPGHPDARVNLALTMEEAGKVEEALEGYNGALAVYPGYLPAIQGLARLTAHLGRNDERMRGWLEEISLRSEDEPWRNWARARLMGMDQAAE